MNHPSRSTLRASKPAEVIHFDTSGPHSKALGGSIYFIIGIDEWSNCRFIQFAKNKTDIKNKVKLIIEQAELLSKGSVKMIISDGGTEFINDEESHLMFKGISQCISSPYTPQENGVAERGIRTVVEAARSALLEVQLPKFLWAEACNCSVYVMNRGVSQRNNEKTRFELFIGTMPDVRNMRIFGQYAVVRVDDRKRKSKWSPKGNILRFVGYTDKFNTYRFYCTTTKQIKISCDVWFVPFAGDVETRRSTTGYCV